MEQPLPQLVPKTTAENNPLQIEVEAGEPTVSSKKKVLRPGMGSKMRSLVLAGLAAAGAGISTDTEAQYTYSQYTYPGQNTTAVAPGTVRVGSAKALGHVVAAGVVNGVLAAAGAPVRVAGVQNGKPILDVNVGAIQKNVEALLKGPIMVQEPQIDRTAIALLRSWNFEIARGVILDPTDPTSALTIGPATTWLSIGTSYNKDQVLVTIKYLKDQTNQYGQLVQIPYEQLWVIGPNPTTGKVAPVRVKDLPEVRR